MSDPVNPEYRSWKGRFAKALILENPDPHLDRELQRLGVEPHRIAEPPSEDELVRLLTEGQHDLLFKRSRVHVTERVVEASKSLAAVMLCCIGHDSVDKDACARRGVMVMNDPVSNGRSVAEMVIGEIIVMSRRIFDSVHEMNESVWRKDNKMRFEVKGKRIGILGLGRIGRQVGQLAESLGMSVSFFDSAEVPREVGLAMGWAACDTVEDLFRAADIVTVHVSAEDAWGNDNRGLVSYSAFKAMAEKPSRSPRLFLNLARGIVVNPDDLLRAVSEELVAYAITDVFPEEPGPSLGRPWVNPYETEPRIFATPHIGAATQEAQPRIARYVARTTQLFQEFGYVRDCVFDPRAKILLTPRDAGAMLAVVHADTRGTKKAVDDAIYQAGASNLSSVHVDFRRYGIAYDLCALDQPLSQEQCDLLVRDACRLTGNPDAIRSVRRVPLV